MSTNSPSCPTYSTCNLVIVSIMSNISNHILRPTLLLQPQSSYSQICEKYFLRGSANRTRVGGLLAANSILRREKEKEGGGRWGGREEICVFCPFFTFTSCSSGWSSCFFFQQKERGRVVRRQSQRGDSVKRSLEASACAPRLRREEYYVLFFKAAFETERRTKMCLLDKNRGRREWGRFDFYCWRWETPSVDK